MRTSIRVWLGPPACCALAVPFLLAACDQGQNGGGLPVIHEAVAQTPSTDAFQAATAAVLPAVVYVQTEARPRMAVTPFRTRAQGQPVPDLVPSGSGSGVFFAEGGYVLTNNHVVQQAERVTVTLYDRRQFEAQVIARDPATDIAVLKVEGPNLPVARVGDSDQLALGQWVLALGSPLGLQFTVTAGIVSATGRSIGILATSQRDTGQQASPLEHFIQTDAAINPGNSGGPLVDLRGSVVGINSAIASPTGIFAGYGFAVPINLARRVAEQLIRYGEVRRPYLGVSLDNVDQVDQQVYGLPSPSGVEVVRLEDGSPAARAGIQLGDVITGVDGQQVQTVPELQVRLAQLDAGSTTQLRVVRYGRTLTIPVTLGLVRSGVRPAARVAGSSEPARMGIAVAERGGDVLVAEVQPYSPAARAGIRPGMIIEQVNRQEIDSVNELTSVIRSAAGGPLSLIVNDPQLGRIIVNMRLGS